MSDTMTELYQCEQCGCMLTDTAANFETAPGHRETITLAFCDGCYDQ